MCAWGARIAEALENETPALPISKSGGGDPLTRGDATRGTGTSIGAPVDEMPMEKS